MKWWRQGALSKKGKVLVTKALALSKIWHIAHALPVPKWAIEEINNEVRDFIWSTENNSYIKLQHLCKPLKQGGLALTNVEHQASALRLKVQAQMFDSECTENWALFGKYWLGSNFKAIEPINGNI